VTTDARTRFNLQDGYAGRRAGRAPVEGCSRQGGQARLEDYDQP